MSLQSVIDTLSKTLLAIVSFIPLLLDSVLVLIGGYLISRLVRWGVRFLLQRLGLQQFSERTGISHILHILGIRMPLPNLLAQISFYFLFLSFVAAALRLLNFTILVTLLDAILSVLPRAISAVVLIFVGTFIAHFLGNALSTVTQNLHILYGKALGKLVEYALVIFVIIIAISALGVDTTVLITSFTIVLASLGLALALAFGFGAREATRNIIAGYYIRQQFRQGQQLTIGHYQGRLRSVSSTYIELETGERDQVTTVTLPNTWLFQQAIVEGQQSPEHSTPPEPSFPPSPDEKGEEA